MPELNDVNTGETIASSWGNDIRDRTIQRYADAAERDTEHPTPTQGDLSYLADTGDVDVYGPTGWTHVGAPVGAIQMVAVASAPTGWLLCQGQAVSRTTYADLFAELGTTYGAGDGSTTFNLPDMRQRFPLGKADSGTGSTLGGTGGALTHTHSGPSHFHSGPSHFHGTPNTNAGGDHNHGGATGSGTNPISIDAGPGGLNTFNDDPHTHSISNSGTHTHSIGNTASSGTDNTGSAGTGQTGSAGTPPFIAVNFAIKT